MSATLRDRLAGQTALRRIAWSSLAVVGTLLSVRGAVAVWQQLTSQEEDTTPAAVPTSATPLTLAERRARAHDLVTRMGEGATVLDVFTSATGLTGVVLDTGHGGRIVAWMPDTHQTLFIGAAFDRDGLNISQQEMVARGFATPAIEPPASARALPAASAPRAAVSFQSLERSAGFVEGQGGPTITAFIDLNCGFCSRLWRQLRAPVAAGQLRVRWVPVGVIAPDSEAKAAALLQHPDPVQALAAHESRRVPLVTVPPTPAVSEAVAANDALLALLTAGRPATPVLVWRGADQQAHVAMGLPPDLPTILREAR